MYPNAIRKRVLYPLHLGIEWWEGYQKYIEKRIEAKNLYKTTKEKKYQAIQETYKLALNGGSFGKTGEETSWQYCQFTNKRITIGSQIDLLMLIEMLELKGIPIMSANTDGIVCLFDKSLNDIYYQVCKEWETIVGNDTLGQLEYQEYTKLVQLSVNDYLAVTQEGKVKQKGDFMTDFELHKNKSFKIIPIALVNYFAHNIPIEETITKHTNIFDFCAAVRAKEDWYFELRYLKDNQIGRTKLQKTNRYYIANDGKDLYKMNMDGREQFVEAHPQKGKSWKSVIFNTYDNYDYNINYQYYIQKCNRIINQLVTKQTTLF